MSWSFGATGNNKAEVVAAFDKGLADDTNCPFHDALSEAVALLLDKFPDDAVRGVATMGHINTDGSGNVRISINC